MKMKVLIFILPSFFKFSIFPSVILIWHIWTFFIKVFSETTWFRIMKSLTILSFSESVTTSDGYRRGYVSFAHFLLYFPNIFTSLGAQKYSCQLCIIVAICSQNLDRLNRKLFTYCFACMKPEVHRKNI